MDISQNHLSAYYAAQSVISFQSVGPHESTRDYITVMYADTGCVLSDRYDDLTGN